MTSFSLTLPAETVFGWHRLSELPAYLKRFPQPIGIVHGAYHYQASGLRGRVVSLLKTAGISWIDVPGQAGEPEPCDVDAAVLCVRDAGVKTILGIGGGSVLDLAKATAALATQLHFNSVTDYLEGVGTGKILGENPLPFCAIPTTAGTGSEATTNSVITSRASGFKKSLRDRRMLADIAFIDPELTITLPPLLTATSGMDAITQLIEAYTTCKAHPVTDVLALQGLKSALALPVACMDGKNRMAREGLALAAYLSGVCLANAGLGAAHAIAAALGSVTNIGHGLACALALPWVMEANMQVVADKYAHVAGILTGCSQPDAMTGARTAIVAVVQLIETLAIAKMQQLPNVMEALNDECLSDVACRCQGNSLTGNPRLLTDGDLITILRKIRDEDRITFMRRIQGGKN